MSNTRVAFLFGAGAEGKNNYDIVTGNDFLKASLYGAHLDGYMEALDDYFKKKYFEDTYKYSKHQLIPSSKMIKNIVIERIRHEPERLFNFIDELSEILNGDDIKELKEEFPKDLPSESSKLVKNIASKKDNKNNKNNKHDKSVENGKPSESNREREFKEIIQKDKYYSSINDGLLKDIFTKNRNGKCDIDANIALGGFIDSFFHTIINPDKYSSIRFSKIFNYYWACYFIVLKDVIELFPDVKKEYMNESTVDFDKILKRHHVFTKEIYQKQPPQNKSYYTAIEEYLRNSNMEIVGVLTTNYFNIAEKVLKIDDENKCAHLNGQLKWMEEPEFLEVFDLEETEPGECLYFPFIFGQSLTKPIVHKKQIEEFYKAVKILEDADCLIILGYGINEDDSHINSLLHEYIMKEDKMMVIVTSNSNNENNDRYSYNLRVSDEKIVKKAYNFSDMEPKDIIDDLMKYVETI